MILKLISTTLAAAILLLALSACNQKKSRETPTTTDPVTTTETPPQTEPEEEQVNDVYQVAGYQKTPCYGKCPVYQVKFYSNGKVTWNGKMNVEKMGVYEAEVPETTLKEIRDKAFEAGYFDLHNEYPIKDKVVDLPTTITYIRVGDMEKSIRNTSEAPQELIVLENYLKSLIDQCDWMPAPGK